MQHRALDVIREKTLGTVFENDLFLVGGAVRDELLGIEHSADFDLVTTHSAIELAHLFAKNPVVYPRFGTAMVRVEGVDIELVTARKESYAKNSRKPKVEAASLLDDASRRDFTINALMQSIHTGELIDPLGKGLRDLEAKVLRTPLDPVQTFHDDPLRMLRAVRFRWKLDFQPAEGLYEAIATMRGRLSIISFERVRDEFVKMLSHPTGPDALNDLMKLGLLEMFAPEFIPMVGCEQGKFHHLDVWDHTLKVLRNSGHSDLMLQLGALFHDIGKPPTRSIDADGNIRFFGHEHVGAQMTAKVLRRLKFSEKEIESVCLLVHNHMRLGSAPVFTESAARRLIRDLGDSLERLLSLVEADANGLKAGVRVMDLEPIRATLEKVTQNTPREKLVSPLSGQEIMKLSGLGPGREVGKLKDLLTELVMEGKLQPDDKESAKRYLADYV